MVILDGAAAVETLMTISTTVFCEVTVTVCVLIEGAREVIEARAAPMTSMQTEIPTNARMNELFIGIDSSEKGVL
jgi:hypothetical protein